LFVTGFAAVSILASGASAQSQITGNDGLAASPRLRQQLNDRKIAISGPIGIIGRVGYLATDENGIAASPKLRQQLAERKTGASISTPVVASAGYRSTGPDGITASPKLRQQLDERTSQPILIAPLK